jgi:hypothetical protein
MTAPSQLWVMREILAFRAKPVRRAPAGLRSCHVRRCRHSKARSKGQSDRAGEVRDLPRGRSHRESPLKIAPPMRDIYARSPRELRAELREGMFSQYKKMPQIEFSDQGVAAIMWYLYAVKK